MTAFPSKELTLLSVLYDFLKAELQIFVSLKSQDPEAVKQSKSSNLFNAEWAFVGVRSNLFNAEWAFVGVRSNQLLPRLRQVDTTTQVTVVLRKPRLIYSEINCLQINYTFCIVTIWSILKFSLFVCNFFTGFTDMV